MKISKEQLLGAPRKRTIVQIPELGGGFVTLQSPLLGEWLDYQAWIAGLPKDSIDHLTRIVAITAVDENGKPLLTEDECRELPHHIGIALYRAAFELIQMDDKVATAKGES